MTCDHDLPRSPPWCRRAPMANGGRNTRRQHVDFRRAGSFDLSGNTLNLRPRRIFAAACGRTVTYGRGATAPAACRVLTRAPEALLKAVPRVLWPRLSGSLLVGSFRRLSGLRGTPACQIFGRQRWRTVRPAQLGLADAGPAWIPALTRLDLTPAPMPLIAERRAVAVKR